MANARLVVIVVVVVVLATSAKSFGTGLLEMGNGALVSVTYPFAAACTCTLAELPEKFTDKL